jgi:hypothetical protein
MSSKNCPWKGLGKKEVAENHEERLKEKEITTEATAMAISCTEPTTKDIVHPNGKFLVPR